MLPPFINIIPLGDEHRTRTVAWVTLGLIVINVAVFLTVNVAGGEAHEAAALKYGLIPARRAPITWITCLFLHGSILHLVFNLFFLWAVAPKLEEALTRPGFLGLYLAGGVAAGAGHVAVAGDSTVPMIGASGAVAAAMGAYIVLFPRNRIKVGYLIWLIAYTRMGVWRVRAKWALGAWFGLSLVWGLWSLAAPGRGGVAHWAHIGGFAFGTAVAGLLRAARLVRRPAAVAVALRREEAALPPGARPEHLERIGLIESALREGRPGVAIAEYQALVDSGSPAAPEAETLWALAQACAEGRFVPQAAAAFERLVALYPAQARAAEAALQVGLIYAQALGHPTKARFYLRRAADTHSDPTRAAVARDMLRLIDLTRGPAAEG